MVVFTIILNLNSLFDSDSSGYVTGGSGGGGYYGGSAGSYTIDYRNISNGAGGAGYCNTTIFICSGSSGANNGNGKATITW